MREYRYVVDHEGRILHDGSDIVDPATLRFFLRAMQHTADGRWLVVCQGEHNWFEVPDTPFVVQRLRLDREDNRLRAVELCFAGDVREPLDPVTLEAEGGRLFCRIRNGAFRARFSRLAMQQLAPFLVEDRGAPALTLIGQRHPIPEVSANAPRFVADVMLGRLAHWLRAMGYDTVYEGRAHDDGLLALAAADDRILITRDAQLAKAARSRGCLVGAKRTEVQLAEIVERLALAPAVTQWFTRCLECNGVLEPREKASVQWLVPARVFAAQTDFTGCSSWGRVFWPGSHFDRMWARLAGLVRRTENQSA